MLGEVANPYEGLPAHMIESVPQKVEVSVQYPPESEVWIDGERKHMLDGIGRVETHFVQLERDGVPLTMADKRGWTAGERDGWREWPVSPEPQEPGGIIDIEAEEVDE